MKKFLTEKNIKQDKGITLIALIITIIVLLILAGVSILMLSGENGILKRAGEAKTSTEQSTILERLRLEAYEKSVDIENKQSNLEYLKSKGIITEETENGEQILDVTKLTTSPSTGKGNMDTGDVYYILEGKLYYKDKDGKATNLGNVFTETASSGDTGNSELPAGFKWLYDDNGDDSVTIWGIDLSETDCLISKNDFRENRLRYI